MAETETQVNDIVSYIHCRDCIRDLTNSEYNGAVSPAEFADFEVGFTPTGVQVWCRRHDKNVIKFDLSKVDISNPVGKVISQAMEGECDCCE